MSPRASAAEVAAFYRQNLSRVRYSMILFNWFGVALIPILLLIVERMRGMAHRTPVLRYCVIGVAGAAPIVFLTSTVFWLLAAFRPDRSPDLTLLTQRPGVDHLHLWRPVPHRPVPVPRPRDRLGRPGAAGVPAVGRLVQRRHRGGAWRPRASPA